MNNFVEFLREANENIPALRIVKYRADGSTDIGLNIKDLFDSPNIVAYYGYNYGVTIFFTSKNSRVKIGSEYVFVNIDNPKRSARHKAQSVNILLDTIKVTKTITTFTEFKALNKEYRNSFYVLVDEELAKKVSTSVSDKEDDINKPEDGYFAIYAIASAYGGDKEVFWNGPFKTQKEAKDYISRQRNKNGLNKSFGGDYIESGSSVHKGLSAFVKAAEKYGLNPNVQNLSWE